MDATISVICFKSKTLANGEHPLMLRITKDRKRTMKSLGVSVHPSNWDFDRNEPKPKCPDRKYIQQIILKVKSEYQTRLLEKAARDEDYTAETLVKEQTREQIQSETVESFYLRTVEQLKREGAVGNAYAYLNSYNVLKSFNADKPLSYTLVKAICITNWDTDGDGELSYEEAAAVTTIGTEFNGKGIFAFDELQYFTGMTSIPSSAFSDCSELLSIKLPDNIISINDTAFARCQSLREIHIPASIESIGTRVFYYCQSLREIHIPANTESIGNGAFESCTKLTTVTFGKESKLRTIAGSYGNSSSYCYGTFMSCQNLSAIEIPASVETIEAAAFHNCKSLATVTFEKKSRLRTIGGGYVSASKSHYGAFSNCTVLTDIEIPASVETIETAAFMGCSSLQTVTFEKGSRLRTIAGQGLSTGTISVTHGAFYKLEKLMTVDMSECTQVESIENCAFHGDSELQLFKIGMKTPPSCGFAAFSDINSSSVLKVPSGCTDAYKAASGWKNFASITGLDE